MYMLYKCKLDDGTEVSREFRSPQKLCIDLSSVAFIWFTRWSKSHRHQWFCHLTYLEYKVFYFRHQDNGYCLCCGILVVWCSAVCMQTLQWVNKQVPHSEQKIKHPTSKRLIEHPGCQTHVYSCYKQLVVTKHCRVNKSLPENPQLSLQDCDTSTININYGSIAHSGCHVHWQWLPHCCCVMIFITIWGGSCRPHFHPSHCHIYRL